MLGREGVWGRDGTHSRVHHGQRTGQAFLADVVALTGLSAARGGGVLSLAREMVEVPTFPLGR